MSEKESDGEELDFLVDKLERDNWKAEFEQSEVGLRKVGEDLKIAPKSK